ELRGWLHRDGLRDDEIEVVRAIDCRYVGQGYELRVTLEGPFEEDALERFHELHRRGDGGACGDPTEIVNARVTAIGRRPALHGLSVTGGTLADALVGKNSSQFRVNGGLRACSTSYFDRSRLPLEESFAGPAVVFHADTTTVVPPG